jgi:hypothetical protein
MADVLKAGGLGSQAHAGTPPEFANSMAQQIEQALNDLLVAEGRNPMSTANSTATRDRRMLFVAIARGVVNHLVDNADAFRIEANDGTPIANRRIDIEKTGP